MVPAVRPVSRPRASGCQCCAPRPAKAGTKLTPPLFGLTAQYLSAALFPLFLAVQLALMFLMYEKLLRAAKKRDPACKPERGLLV